MLPREQLYRHIDARVDEMFDHGLVAEVERLRAQGLSTATTAGQAIGYKEVLQMLDGTITCEEAREAIKAGTRRYAKRQISWFKHDGRVRWIDMEESDPSSAASLIISEAYDGAL